MLFVAVLLSIVPLAVILLSVAFDVLLPVTLSVVFVVLFEVALVAVESFEDPDSDKLPDETETLVKYLTLFLVTIIFELL